MTSARLAPLACAALATACGATVRVPRQHLSAKQIVERSKPAIVRIETPIGVGTGFVVAADGRIATNLHVLRGAREAKVTLLDGTELPVALVLAADELHDLAIVSVEAHDLPILALGDSDVVAAGDPVLAIGNPLGVFDYTVSDGLISSVRKVDPTLTVLQISAPISRGSSGGPLLNGYGEVIGVATFIADRGQNLNFGVPSNYLRPMMLRQGGETLTALADRLGSGGGEEAEGGGEERACKVPRIVRQVPQHDPAVLDGCSDRELLEVVDSITQAISAGAPLYNACDHDACFRIYEGTALRLDHDLTGCVGVRDALGQGLLRASTVGTAAEKAWAMRDAFDGLLEVIMRHLSGRQPAP